MAGGPAGASGPAQEGGGGGGGGPRAPAGPPAMLEPWAMNHQPLIVDEFMNYSIIYHNYQLFWYIKSKNKGSFKSQKSRNRENCGSRIFQ